MWKIFHTFVAKISRIRYLDNGLIFETISRKGKGAEKQCEQLFDIF